LKKLFSVISFALLLTSTLVLAFGIQPVEAGVTIYILPDGSVDPPTAPIQRVGDTYSLYDNIYDSVVVGRDNIIIDGAGYALEGTGAIGSVGMDLSHRENVTVRSMQIKSFYIGIRIFGSNNNVSGNALSNNNNGIYLYSLSSPPNSGHNSISGNNITANTAPGIHLERASNNSINDNTIARSVYGIYLRESSNNSISGNKMTLNDFHGIFLQYSSNYNSISGNDITANKAFGILLHTSSNNNSIVGNNVTNNLQYGIYLDSSSKNTLYHNNFIYNNQQVYSSSSTNTWDNGFPSGGNFWGDYEDRYPNATEIDASGLWNTPYYIDSNNQDNYPIIPEFPSATILPLVMALSAIAVVFARKKRLKKTET